MRLPSREPRRKLTPMAKMLEAPRSRLCRRTTRRRSSCNAYAIENALKGLIIANTLRLIGGRELNSELKSHNLIKLAENAEFMVHAQERPVLEALSKLSVWAGRYPVARTRREHVGTPNSDELLDYGSAHPVMRAFFERARKELESRLPQPTGSRFGSLVVMRQPGT
jgi:hypothetical protein